MISRYIIFFVFILFYVGKVLADNTLNELQHEYQGADHDTSRIVLLFDMGNQYLNGPSDSLIFYYDQALVLINKNLNTPALINDSSSAQFVIYRDFKVRALIELGIEYFFRSEYNKALDYYFSALFLVNQMDDVELLSECLSEIGIVYKNQGKFDQALVYYDSALVFANQTGDSSWVASCKVNIGNIYKEKGYLTIALNYYFDALETLEILGHDRRISACYQNIGDIYRQQLDNNKALDYYSKSLQLAINSEDKVRETTCYLNIGYVYFNLKQYDIAREYYYKSYELYQQLGYSHELDDCYILIGDTYFAEEVYDLAVDYYGQALTISDSEGDLGRKSEILGKLGKIYTQKGEFIKALEYSINGLKIAEEVGAIELIIQITQNLSEIYEMQGKNSMAIAEHKKLARLKDSLFSVEKYKAITEMEVKYESAKKEQQLVLLEERTQIQHLKLSRRNRLYYSSLLILSLIAVLVYILYRNQRLKSRHRAIELEQKLMRSQMNPHFIFNSLIAIQSYIYKQDAVKAGDYLAKFADLIRITLEHSRADFVPFEKELKMLRTYLELQVLRFEKKFVYKIDVSSDVSAEQLKIPPMMAQPFIENSIEHGFRNKEDQGEISIKYECFKGFIRCTVEDNGIGREKAIESKKSKDHQSMATSITTERLEILSKREKKDFKLNILDLKNEAGMATGTKVVFDMPYRIAEQY